MPVLRLSCSACRYRMYRPRLWRRRLTVKERDNTVSGQDSQVAEPGIEIKLRIVLTRNILSFSGDDGTAQEVHLSSPVGLKIDGGRQHLRCRPLLGPKPYL